jgi:hypothetical protein
MMRRIAERLPRILLLAAGFGTGLAMIILGLGERFTRAVPDGALAQWFGTGLIREMGFSEGFIGWGLILLGSFWLAASSALSVRHGWGYWTVMLAAFASLAFFPGGVAVAILAAAILGFSRPRNPLPENAVPTESGK